MFFHLNANQLADSRRDQQLEERIGHEGGTSFAAEEEVRTGRHE